MLKKSEKMQIFFQLFLYAFYFFKHFKQQQKQEKKLRTNKKLHFIAYLLLK